VSVPREVSTDLFRLIAEFTYDWETWVDARGKVRWINAAVWRITGYSVAECLAREDYPLFLAQAADRPVLARVLADAGDGGSGNDVEFRVVHKDGEPRWVAISWQMVRSSNGQSLGYRTSVRDIHQRKQMEDELHAIRRRAEALAQARSELLANVSHELRSPAHHIAGFAQLLAEESLSPRQHRYAKLITEQAHSMLRQVEDLLSLTALEAGGVELAREPVDLVALCEGLVEGSAPEAAARGLSLSAAISVRERWREGDAQRIGQILRNLVDNALKFTERGTVELRVSEACQGGSQGVLFEVVDTGPGMDPAQLESLLLPFHQGDASSRRRHGGVGLGLAIVERLVRAMQGELTIESQPGLGTTARVALPLALLPIGSETVPARRLGSGGVALVIDDSAVARELLCELLQGLGLVALEAASPEQARALVEERRIDVVFLDYQMPGSDGAEVALSLRRALVAREPTRHVPIYILTANVFVRDQLRGARGSIDGILTKPLSRAALSEVIQGLEVGQGAVHLEPAAEASVLLDMRVVDDLRSTGSPGAPPLLHRLLPRVEDDMRSTLLHAAENLATQAWDALGRDAHAAAGHAAIVGALRARDLARSLELSLEQPPGHIRADSARSLLHACEDAWREALAQLQELVRSGDP
jgi:PAS domain S-box-containing protein